MGVDAGIFAKKAKKYIWFDRMNNVREYANHDDLWNEHLEDIYLRLINDREETGANVIALMEANIMAWMRDPNNVGRASCCTQIIDFVLANPDDTFFIASDHDDALDLMGEPGSDVWTGKYMKWEP